MASHGQDAVLNGTVPGNSRARSFEPIVDDQLTSSDSAALTDPRREKRENSVRRQQKGIIASKD